MFSLSLLVSAIYLCYVIFIISGLFRHKKLIIESQINSPSVSVVIAARNEELNLPYIIQDLIAQEYPLNKLEVIFIDDRSTDSTNQILKKACDDYGFIKYIQIKNLNEGMTPKKNALSKGIEIASGEIIISTDADCRVGKFWVSSMAYSVKNKDCITIGYSEIDENQKSIFELYQKLDFFGIIIANAGAAGWNCFWSGTGQNLAYFKKDYLAIDGFEKVKDRISGDDMHLVQSISKIKKGYMHIDPNSFTKTRSLSSIRDFINQRIRWSSNAKSNLKDNPFFFGFLLTSFSINVIILLTIFLENPLIYIYLLKFISDGIIIYLGSKLFERKIYPLIYCLWAIIQPVYIPIIGLLGIKEKFTWKP